MRRALTICVVQAAHGKTGMLREIQTADAAARNHPADGGINFSREWYKIERISIYERLNFNLN